MPVPTRETPVAAGDEDGAGGPRAEEQGAEEGEEQGVPEAQEAIIECCTLYAVALLPWSLLREEIKATAVNFGALPPATKPLECA